MHKIIERVICTYILCSAIMISVLLLQPDYNLEIFRMWWIVTILVSIYLVIYAVYLRSLRKIIDNQALIGRLDRRKQRIAQ